MKWVFQLGFDRTHYLIISLKGSARFYTSAQLSFSYALDSALV